jgi:thioredoxin reductase (NADPH)
VVSYEYIDLDDPADGTTVLDAQVRTVAAPLGGIASPQTDPYDLSIYGAGPAGLSAAVYAASGGLRVVLIERHAVGEGYVQVRMVRRIEVAPV